MPHAMLRMTEARLIVVERPFHFHQINHGVLFELMYDTKKLDTSGSI